MKKDWTYKKLGEVATIYDSQRKPVTKKDRKPGPYPYYGATGVQDYVDKYIFDGRYVLVGEDGARWSSNEKSAYIIEGKSWVNNHAHVLSFDNSIIDYFIVYYLNYSNLDPYITGAIIKKLTQKDLLSISIPIPPLSIQRSIVAELDLLHSVISKKKEQLRELDNLAQSLFYQMFGDPITNPMGWEIKKLGEVCGILNGYAFKSNKYVDKGIRVIRIANVQKGIIVDDQPAFYPLSTQFEIDKYILNEGDILMSLTGNVGRVGILQKEMLPAALNQRVACLRISDNSLYSKFFFHYLNSDLFEQKCIASARGIAQLNMSTEWLKEQFIPIPPLSLQQSFAAKVSAIEVQKQAITQSIQHTEALLAQRMDNYFGI